MKYSFFTPKTSLVDPDPSESALIWMSWFWIRTGTRMRIWDLGARGSGIADQVLRIQILTQYWIFALKFRIDNRE